MKKSLLALLIGATVSLVACNDKDSAALNEKLQAAEQQNAQLQRELDSAKQAASQLEDRLQQAEHAALAIEPAIIAKPVVLFQKQEQFHFEKKENADEAFIEESSLSYDVSALETNLDWLNRIIYVYLYQINQQPKNANSETAKSKAAMPDSLDGLKTAILESLQQDYQEDQQELQGGESLGITYNYYMDYIGQRNHYATLKGLVYVYNGGAHGLYATTYLNIDLKNKRLFGLDDLLPKAAQKAVENRLWEIYQDFLSDNEMEEPFLPKEDFSLPDNFYFSPIEREIVFHFPLYALAPYAFGEVDLRLPWDAIKDKINPDYRDIFEEIPIAKGNVADQ